MSIRVYVYDRAGRSVLYMGYRDPATGRKYSRSTGTNNRREAERAAAIWEQEVNAINSSDGSIPYDHFVALYSERHCSTLEPSSARKYLGSLSMLRDIIRPRTLADVTTARLADFVHQLRRSNRSESTCRGHIRAIKAALNWAARDAQLIPYAPQMPRAKRQSRRTIAKGRAITYAEFVAMMRATREVCHEPRQWRRNLRCLWLSGLRLSEAIELDWSDQLKIHIDLSGEYPYLVVPGDRNKDGDDHLLPITPDWHRWLLRVPVSERVGAVLEWPRRRRKAINRYDQMTNYASKVISEIGEASGVVVNQSTGKFASAHDLRRSFGLRWSRRVPPNVLQLLMRHDDITTTMAYYVGRDVEHAAELVASLPSTEARNTENT